MTSGADQSGMAASIDAQRATFCPRTAAQVQQLVQLARHASDSSTSGVNASLLMGLQQRLRTNALVALGLSDDDRSAVLRYAAKTVLSPTLSSGAPTAEASSSLTAAAFTIIDNVLSTTDAGVGGSVLSPTARDALCDAIPECLQRSIPTGNDTECATCATWSLYAVHARLMAADGRKDGDDEARLLTTLLTAEAASLSDVCESVKDTLTPENLRRLTQTLRWTAVSLVTLATRAETEQQKAMEQCEALAATLKNLSSHVRTANGECLAAYVAAWWLVSGACRRDQEQRSLPPAVADRCLAVMQDAATTSADVPLLAFFCGPQSTETLAALTELRTGASALKTKIRRLPCEASSREGLAESTVALKRKDVQPIATLFVRLHEVHGSPGVLAAALLTPAVLECLLAVLVHVPSEPESTEACDDDREEEEADLDIATVLDLWLPLLQTSPSTAEAETEGSSAQSNGDVSRDGAILVGLRATLTQAFLYHNGAERLVNFLFHARPHVRVLPDANDAEAEAQANASGMRQGRLLSAWHLLEIMVSHSTTSSARLVFEVGAMERAVNEFLRYCVSIETESEIRAFFLSPTAVEMLTTALSIVPTAVNGCARCLDPLSQDEMADGQTPLSLAAEKVFGESGDEMVATVATVITTAAMMGNGGVVTAGLDALVVLASAFPCAASRAVDLDFLSESLEVWKTLAAADTAEDTPEAKSAVDVAAATKRDTKEEENSRNGDGSNAGALTVRDCLTLGTFRVMGALVKRVPQAVNLEWIEMLVSGIGLLAFHRSRPKANAEGKEGFLALGDAFVLAFLPCLVASVSANEEAAEYIFEDEAVRALLWDELRSRHAEALTGTEKEKRIAAFAVPDILTVTRFFPQPLSWAIYAEDIRKLLPTADAGWYCTGIPRTLAELLVHVTTNTERGTGYSDALPSNRDEGPVGTALAILVGEAASAIVSSPGGVSMSASLSTALHHAGPLAFVSAMDATSVTPADSAELDKTMPRLMLITSALAQWRPMTMDAATGESLWKAASRLGLQSMAHAMGPVTDSATDATHVTTWLLFCQQALSILNAVANVPSLAAKAVLVHAVLASETAHADDEAAVHHSFLTQLSSLASHLLQPREQGSPSSVAVVSALEDAVFATISTLWTQATVADAAADTLAASTGWNAFVECVLFPLITVQENGTHEGAKACFLLLLNVASARKQLLAHHRTAYQVALLAVEPGVVGTPAALAFDAYKKEAEVEAGTRSSP